MLDTELARLYGVEVRTLNQAVRRNAERFPKDFMFQISWEEAERSRSQFVILNEAAGGRPIRGKNVKYRPLAFTEQGVAMLSSVLRSKQAVLANVEIMRAFVRLRAMAATVRILPEGLTRSNRNTTANSRWCSMPSGR